MQRFETVELEDAIRERWRKVAERTEPVHPLTRMCDRWEEAGARLLARASAMRIDVGAPRERGVPDDVASALHHCAPQALLRDLHRPISDYMITELDRTDVGWDRGGRTVMGDVRRQIREGRAIPIRSLLDNQKAIREDLGELAAIKALPWDQAPKLSTEAATTTSGMPTELPSFREEILREKGLVK